MSNTDRAWFVVLAALFIFTAMLPPEANVKHPAFAHAFGYAMAALFALIALAPWK